MYRSVYIESVIKNKTKTKPNQNLLFDFQSVCLPVYPLIQEVRKHTKKKSKEKKIKPVFPQ